MQRVHGLFWAWALMITSQSGQKSRLGLNLLISTCGLVATMQSTCINRQQLKAAT
jgi:hypothetical protein